MTITAIIVAAGKGVRAGDGPPKQYRTLSGVPVLRRSVEVFQAHPGISKVIVVINPDHADFYEKAVGDLELPSPVAGGRTRQESVLNGLTSLEGDAPGIVLIHDAARAFVSLGLIERVIDEVSNSGGGAIPSLPVCDTLKKGKDGIVEETISRDGLFTVQTPQGFPYPEILNAHKKAVGKELTDDAAVAEAAGMKVALVAGAKENIKLTNPEDFAGHCHDVRTGSGFDVHAFEDGDHVILCGVKIPHEKGLRGHSDADAGLHALTDAILGAIGEGDIGDHFPPSDDKWKDAPSDLFLRHAASLVEKAGGTITNVDVTLICEAPKIAPHRAAMQNRVAEILGLEVARVSIKATTTEQLGFTGRGEGLAAQATATVVF
ncbi:MAG: bifunctional 2-C-methyl-D-erythritol 4-phosphate cytidylyltransferase/2-C-methyl-D-erythritol 2,4-cyclodiphosphate synthase [Alphaproteobacteria bacterium]|nr:MAG: bifunctional 2-C-methyl-D-erythritol 4-phosphate cytidylyltransferase/2-C-methyl-D-erythritol 2,4-cyclodiphosphate synthase [Alphaproteobacteria bacterium]